MQRHDAGDGPEVLALRSMRRWLVLLSSSAAVVATLGFAAPNWPGLGGWERLGLALAALCALAAVLRSQASAWLWAAAAAMLVLMLVPLLAPAALTTWVPVTTLASYLAYYLAVLLPGRLGLGATVAPAALLAFVWTHAPAAVIPGRLVVMEGRPLYASVVVAACLLWWTWQRLLTEAHMADARLAAAERGLSDAVMAQERLALWRAAATRLHESVLNTLRYVLTTATVDRTRLAEEVRHDATAPMSSQSVPLHNATEVMDAVKADRVAGPYVRVVDPVPSLPLEPRVAEAMRGAIVELARNALRHSQAQHIGVSVTATADAGLRTVVEHDGVASDRPGVPGLGIGVVLEGAITEAGGVWRRRPDGSTVIDLPLAPRHRELVAGAGTVDRGRLLMTAPLVGVAAVGSLHYVELLAGADALPRLAALLGLVAVLHSVRTFARRRRLDGVGVVVGVLAPGLLPWVMLAATVTCAETPLVAAALNISGLVVIITAAWTPPRVGMTAGLLWASGGMALYFDVPAACRDALVIALLNALVATPIVIAVTTAGARAFERTKALAREARHREFLERTRAAVASDVNAALHDAVRQATTQLNAIVQGAQLDDGRRRVLQLADGRIRAAIQVDPRTAGAVAVLALHLVEALAVRGRAVEVRAIRASGDDRPLPEELSALLVRLVMAAGSGARLHVFSDGVDDYLSLLVDGSGLAAEELAVGDVRWFADARLEVDAEEDDGDRVAVLVSRPVVTAATATAAE